MRKSYIFYIILFACLLASPAYAVDYNLFSQDDFVDPQDRGYTFKPDTDEDFSRGNDLMLTNFRFGRSMDYQQREIFTESKATFGQIDLNYYRNTMQFGLKYDTFDTAISDQISQDRLKLLVGFYRLQEKTVSRNRDTVKRVLFTWEESEIPKGKVNEYGLDFDFEMFNILGGFTLSKRLMPKRLKDEHRILYRYFFDWDNLPIQTRISFGAAEVNNTWDFAITQFMVNYYLQIPKTFSEVHFYYSFAHRPERGHMDEKSNNEFGLFVNIPLTVFSGEFNQ